MTEHDELEDILSKAEEGEESRDKLGAPWVAQTNVSVKQWIVEGNDSFAASGETVKTLPAGMYKVSVDDRGVMHFRMTPVLTDKIIDLKDTASDEIIAGIRKFWESQAAFNKLGMLYKRGILLWGPAGSGKTVTVTILMRELVVAGGAVLFCEKPHLSVHALEMLRKGLNNSRLIVVVEGFEENVPKFCRHTILALLDGEHQVANVVNIATTNFPERLGARIVNRPSRFDHVRKIGMPNDAARHAYLEATVPKGSPFCSDIHKWVEDTNGMSIAHIRELVVATMCLGEDYDTTIDRLKKMGTKVTSSSEFKSPVGMAPSPKANGRTSIANPAGI